MKETKKKPKVAKVTKKGTTKAPKTKKTKMTTKKKASVSSKKKAASTKKKPSVVSEKEVYASGDKILVSVNFKRSTAKKKKSATTRVTNGDMSAATSETAANKKPTVVIDVMASPYQVYEPSPPQVFDVLSEDEADPKANASSSSSNVATSTSATATTSVAATSTTASTSAPPASASVAAHSGDEESSFLRGPCTPPPPVSLVDGHESLDFSKGPQTPSSPTDHHIDSYDPCDPTESPVDADKQLWDEAVLSKGLDKGQTEAKEKEKDAAAVTNGSIPFIDSTLSADNDHTKNNGVNRSTNNNDLTFPMEMDSDSPCSPHGSDLSDFFEPPSSLPTISKRGGNRPSKMKTRK